MHYPLPIVVPIWTSIAIPIVTIIIKAKIPINFAVSVVVHCIKDTVIILISITSVPSISSSISPEGVCHRQSQAGSKDNENEGLHGKIDSLEFQMWSLKAGEDWLLRQGIFILMDAESSHPLLWSHDL